MDWGLQPGLQLLAGELLACLHSALCMLCDVLGVASPWRRQTQLADGTRGEIRKPKPAKIAYVFERFAISDKYTTTRCETLTG